MDEPGFSRFSSHHLDPGALEFFPSAPPQQILYPYPPPPTYDNMGYARPQFPSPPPFFGAPAEPPPPPPLPLSFPPVSPAPSRTLLLSMVPASVSESTVRRELEIFGDVRAVQMERRREGLVTVHFYDVRDAQAALAAIQDQHMQQQFRIGRHYDAVLNNSMALMSVAPPPPLPQTARGLISGRVVWAHFITPVTSGLPDGNNQGSLVVFHLSPGVSASYLKQIFEAFGPVKELRETPNKRNQRFVEFYDVRNAAKAMAGMNGKEICGKPIVVEFSRPGGHCRKTWRGGPQNGAPFTKMNPCPNNNYPSRNSSRRFTVTPVPALTRPPPPECKPSMRRPPTQYRNYDSRGNPNGSDGSKSWSSGSSSLHGYDSQECSNNYNKRPLHKKNNPKKMNNNINSTSVSDSGGCGSSKQTGYGVGRALKGGGTGGARRAGKDHDPRFLINEDAIVESNCRDCRTTVMIKNIPNKYSQKLLLHMLDNHCIHCNEQIADGDDQPLSSYDFVYLPIDFINKCNVGYGFVNMTSPEATLRLYKAFHHQNWEVFNSRKICEVTYARLQGLEALREHFKTSKFPGDAEEYMPVIFSPPRDGVMLPDPVPIVGRDSSSSCSSKENESEPQIDRRGIDNASCDEEDENEDEDGTSGSYDENKE